MNKLISIYIPTKNRVELLKRAVNSVLKQTYSRWELIIVNDGSTDETENYLNSLAQSDTRIKVIHHAESQGACASRNEAIFSATGEFITGLDDDDFFYKDRLQRFIENWNENVVALFASLDVMKNGEIKHFGVHKPFTVSQKDLLYRNYIANQLFTKTKYLQEIGGFDASFKMWQDFDCWYRLLSLGTAQYVPFATYVFEESERGDRISGKSTDTVIQTYNLFVKKHNLNKREAAALQLHFIYYGIDKYSVSYCINKIIATGFNAKIIKYLTREYLFPKFRNILVSLGIKKKLNYTSVNS